jgi:8-oxo-dGTP diphosphatase
VTVTAHLEPTVVVDVANVMGARADGWWRDRPGAALRLYREIADLAARGIPADRLPAGLPAADGSAPCWVLVLEGRARDAASRIGDGSPLVRVVSAPGSADDAIVAEVAALPVAGSCLVVTADRELRRRCEALGASVAGPGWLLGML